MDGSHCNTQTIFTTEVDQILLVAKTKQNRRELWKEFTFNHLIDPICIW